MNKKCKRCKWEINEINLTEIQRLEIYSLINQDLKMFAIQKLKDELKLSLKEAKGIVVHLNKEYGNCIRCNFDKLIKENIECPKCKAFNYNLKIETSFNKEFCDNLEFKLDFDNLDKEEVKGFWCDGINHIPNDIKSLLKANLVNKKELKTNAWIGKDGQGEYKMTIKFGNQSIEKYKQNQSLVNCIPTDNFQNWINIIPEKNEIEITLK